MSKQNTNKKEQNEQKNKEQNKEQNKELNKQKNNNVVVNNNNKSNSNRYKTEQIENESILHLIPIFLIICIIPLIIRTRIYDTRLSQFNWFADSDNQIDFFLFYKQWAFIIVAGFMTIAVAFKTYIKRKTIKFIPIFIPLAIYALLSLLSAIFSKYASFSFAGSYEMFESVFALLGYCVVIYYSYLFINTERDVKLILYYILGIALFMSVLGVFQFMGHDFFTTSIGYDLIVPTELQNGFGITFNFNESQVYLTLYNPNYVGVYVALIVPILIVLIFLQKKIVLSLLLLTAAIGLVICVIGSQSLTGLIGIAIACVFAFLFMWRYLIKRFYITIICIIILIVGIFSVYHYKDDYLINKWTEMLNTNKTEYNLSDLQTEDDGVRLTYKDNTIKIRFITNSENPFKVTDSAGQDINIAYDSAANLYRIADERFSDITFGLSTTYVGGFVINVEGYAYTFTNLTGDNKYYYVNRFNKTDRLITAESAIFTGYERFASGRGYIWSRTIPLLKDYIFLGSGPDTYTMVFPQQDYMNLSRSGFGDSVLTKPHSMFLQMGVQTGVLSLIAFLVFYGMYVLSSTVLYIRGRFTSLYAKAGVAIFIGTISYIITGITNDSNISTSPVFWTLLGVGIAANQKAKPLIKEEVIVIKQKKAEKLALKNSKSLDKAED